MLSLLRKGENKLDMYVINWESEINCTKVKRSLSHRPSETKPFWQSFNFLQQFLGHLLHHHQAPE